MTKLGTLTKLRALPYMYVISYKVMNMEQLVLTLNCGYDKVTIQVVRK